MTRIRINDIELNVITSGAGAPLVLLHGFTGSAANWTTHRAVFDRHFQTAAIDLLGHGASDAPADAERYRMTRGVDDLRACFDKLNLQRVHLLGYSMGGRVALHFAHKYPERIETLILESASPGIADAAERAARIASDQVLAERIEREGIAAFVAYWEQRPLFATQARLSQATRDALHAQRLQNNPRGLANSLRGMGTGAQESLWERLPQIHTRTLLITGALDEKFTNIARQMSEIMPNARHVSIADAGHAAHVERPMEFEKIVLKGLRTDHWSLVTDY
ncbi:MAG: 2-succinyl-6-hydroxy-2,4-cyclohexadiene-1-carboxylate synthase [Chloroflexi bacterium]|nr:2-succinyl-6-hydroxy-2,4-cyclohexadiene-1-carboxylate synthase [Chloroflexota bacterium]